MQTLPNRIELRVSGLSHVPSFKNSKQIGRNRKTGKPFVRTNDRSKEWMEQCIQSFVSQLRSLSLTDDTGTPMAHSPRFSTASLKQFDDTIFWIPEQHIAVAFCDKDQEGARVVLEVI